MLGLVRAAVLGAAMVAAVPAQAGFDLSADLIAVTDLGGGDYSFSQGGWTGGGLVTGTFSGLDMDGNQQLDWYLYEISAFSLSFSGNAYTGAFSLGYDNLYELVYDLDGGGVLGDGYLGDWEEGILAFGNSNLYAAGPGQLDFCGGFYACALIAEVPEPSSWAMLIAGFGLTGAVMRRRRYRAA